MPEVNAHILHNAQKIFGFLWLIESLSIYVRLSCIGFS